MCATRSPFTRRTSAFARTPDPGHPSNFRPFLPSNMSDTSFRALIVEDEPHIRQYLELVLQSLGCGQREQAGSVEQARAIQAASPCDLILLDVNLPGEDGLAWLRELREAGDETVVVVISAQISAALVMEAAELGADGYLRKDMKREDLMAELRRLIDETLG